MRKKGGQKTAKRDSRSLNLLRTALSSRAPSQGRPGFSLREQRDRVVAALTPKERAVFDQITDQTAAPTPPAAPVAHGRTRYFEFWCMRCPTRVRVATEVPCTSPDEPPEVVACPSCGGAMESGDVVRESGRLAFVRPTTAFIDEELNIERREAAVHVVLLRGER